MTEVTFGGIPVWLLTTYLGELGGTQEEEGIVRGERWTATLVSHKAQLGALAIGRVTVTIKGSAEEETMEALRKKALRGGG